MAACPVACPARPDTMSMTAVNVSPVFCATAWAAPAPVSHPQRPAFVHQKYGFTSMKPPLAGNTEMVSEMRSI